MMVTLCRFPLSHLATALSSNASGLQTCSFYSSSASTLPEASFHQLTFLLWQGKVLNLPYALWFQNSASFSISSHFQIFRVQITKLAQVLSDPSSNFPISTVNLSDSIQASSQNTSLTAATKSTLCAHVPVSIQAFTLDSSQGPDRILHQLLQLLQRALPVCMRCIPSYKASASHPFSFSLTQGEPPVDPLPSCQ